jgi:hypothetical protein
VPARSFIPYDSAGTEGLIFGAGLNKEMLWFSRGGLDLHIDTGS